MFIMQGEEVMLVRYIVEYTEEDVVLKEQCVSEAHKQEVEDILTHRQLAFTSKAVEQTGNEWFNGLRFPSYDKAKEVFERGEQAYLADKRMQEVIDNLQLRADIDFLSIMSGVEL